MKTIYLNFEIKKKIKANVKEDVFKKIKKSEAGKELESLKKKIIKKLRQLVKKQCPDSDIEILKKYDSTEMHELIRISIDSNDKIKSAWYRAKDAFEIGIEPEIVSQRVSNDNYFLISLLKTDDSISETCTIAYKINDSLMCEADKIITAYMARVERFRTVKTLLNAYPDMKKFIPKAEKEVKKEAPPEDKTIKLYEAS